MIALDTAFPPAWARAPSRQLDIAKCRCQLLLPILCGVVCAVQAAMQQPAHVFATCLMDNLWRQFNTYSSSCWSVEVHLWTSTNATTFPPRLPVAISDCTTFSASSGGIDTYNTGLARVLYSLATHLARTLAYSGCPVSVSAHPVLMGAFSVSRRHTFLGVLVYIL